MQFSSRKPNAEPVAAPERAIHVDLKFTQTGRYLIAAGSYQPAGQEHFQPVLYISVVGAKDWAVAYPLDGRFATNEAAAAAAFHYGIQIITRQVRDMPLPGEPLPAPTA